MPKQTRRLKSLALFLVSCVFALFGVLKPYSNLDVLHLFLFSFLITLLLYSNKRKVFSIFFVLWIITLSIALLAYFIYHPNLFAPAFIAVGIGVISSFALRKFAQISNEAFVFLLITFFLISSFSNSQSLRTTVVYEPGAKSYFNDYLGFLRNFYMVEKGINYYDALVTVHTEDGRSSTIPQKAWNWRLPSYAYLWKFFPGSGGISVYIFFLTLSSVALYFTYQIGRTILDSDHANLIPYVLLPYFHFGARDLSFLEMEWWGLVFLILATFAIIKNRLNLLFVSSIASMVLRELYVVPIFLWSILMAAGRNYQKAQVLSFALIIFLIVIAFHYFKVTEYIPRTWDSLSFDQKTPDIIPLQQTLSYGSVDYLFFRFRPFLVSLVATPLLLIVSFYRKKINLNLLIVPLSALFMAIFSLKFATKDADYWGITYIPLLLISFVTLSVKNASNDEKVS